MKERTGAREGDTRGILTSECQSGCLRKFGRDTMPFEPERLGKRLKARQIDHKCVNFVVSACANRLGILCPQLCNFFFKISVAGCVYGTSKSMKSATSSLQSRRFDSEVTDVYILHLLC